MKPHERTESATSSCVGPTSDQHSIPSSDEPEIALPDLDAEVIGKWQSYLPPDKFEELVASQLEGAKSLVQSLWEAGQSANLADIKRAAHDAKGVCGNLGMAKVCHLADGLGRACLSGQEQEALDLLQAIKQAMPTATAAFEDRFVNRCKGDST